MLLSKITSYEEKNIIDQLNSISFDYFGDSFLFDIGTPVFIDKKNDIYFFAQTIKIFEKAFNRLSNEFIQNAGTDRLLDSLKACAKYFNYPKEETKQLIDKIKSSNVQIDL